MMSPAEKKCAKHKPYRSLKTAMRELDSMRARLQRQGEPRQETQRLNIFECPANDMVQAVHYHIGRLTASEQKVRIKTLWRKAQFAAARAERAYLRAADAKAKLDLAESEEYAYSLRDRLFATAAKTAGGNK